MQHDHFAPLYRSTIGFDRLFRLLDNATSVNDAGSGFPPYNIERMADDAYRITMAVAGFKRDELHVEVKENTLSVRGEKEQASTAPDYLYRGIAQRGFERRFQLADHVEIRGADLVDGLLHIDLVRELPERMKPRKIAIGETVTSADSLAAA